MGRGDGDACAGMTPDGKCGGSGEACGRENMADGACQEGEASADGSGTGSKDSATNCEPAGQPAIARRSAQQAMREQREGELEQLNEDAELHTLVKAATTSEPPTERGRGTARPTCTPRGLPGYRFRSARQVAPAVAIAIVPLATFHEQKRYRQTGGPDRLSGVAAFVLSVEAGTRNEMGLDEYVVVHGRARTTEAARPSSSSSLPASISVRTSSSRRWMIPRPATSPTSPSSASAASGVGPPVAPASRSQRGLPRLEDGQAGSQSGQIEQHGGRRSLGRDHGELAPLAPQPDVSLDDRPQAARVYETAHRSDRPPPAAVQLRRLRQRGAKAVDAGDVYLALGSDQGGLGQAGQDV
jgi:hypothetical protein